MSSPNQKPALITSREYASRVTGSVPGGGVVSRSEEITFNYLTSEWDMAEAFECRCGAERCLGNIRGFKHLTPAEQAGLEPLLTPFLRSLRALGLPSAA